MRFARGPRAVVGCRSGSVRTALRRRSPTQHAAVPTLVLLLLTVLWGTTFPIVDALRAHTDAAPLVALRFGIGLLAMAAVWALRRDPVTPALWRHGALLGLALAAGFALQTEGLGRTTPARSAFITGLSVLLVPVVARAFGRRVAAVAWIGVGLAVLGLTVLTQPLADLAGGVRLGDLLTAGCALAFALHIAALSEWAPRHALAALTTVQFAVVLAVALVWMPFAGRRVGPAMELLPWLLFLGPVMTAGAIFLQSWAQGRSAAVRAALIYALEPVFAALFARLWGHQAPSAAEWTGGVLIIAGVLVAEVAPTLMRRGAQRSVDATR